MEFWGVEVPSGKPLTCKPGVDSYVHVSQAALGDNKSSKGNDRVVLKVKVGSNEVVVGTLSQGKCDQTTLDLIFEKDFVLSHNSSGSVFFCGYRTDAVKDDVTGSSDDEFDDSEDDFEEDTPKMVQSATKENGKLGSKGVKEALVNKPPTKSPASKVEVTAVEVKPKLKPAAEELSKGAEKSEDEDEDDDDDDEDEDEDDDDLGSGSDDEDMDSDSDSDDEDDSEEEQLKPGKKRPFSTGKPDLPSKKSKIATLGKPDSKSPSVPASTPKQQQSVKKEISAKKTPGKENAATPASGKKLGQHFCEPCKKSFNSEAALSQHKSAKHK